MHPITLKTLGLLSKCIPKLPYPVLSGHLKGIRFIFGSPAGECGGISLYVNRAEPEQLEAFSGIMKPGNVFWDIGANVGLYTLLASRLTGEQGSVLSVEPDLRNLSYLHRHLRLNKCQNVTVLAGACSDQTDLLFFKQGLNCATGQLDSSGSRSDSAPVLSTSLDALCEGMDVIPDVIKIDVEGAEMDVLKGACHLLKTHKPTLFLSTHSKDLRRDCLEYLEGLGYNITPLNGEVKKSSEFIAQAG